MIPAQLLDALRLNLGERQIGPGIGALDRSEGIWSHPDPSRSGSGRLAGWLAQWVDVGYRDWSVVRPVVAAFTATARAHLTLLDYSHLRIADAALAMAGEEWDTALAHLDFILALAPDLNDGMLLAVANYWKARTLRQKGEYEEALPFARQGEKLAEQLEFPCMAAVMQVLESWLLFQRGRTRDAWNLLRQCETVLAGTDDHVVLGNIQSAYGRMLRRQGRYEQAIGHFERSIDEYRQVNSRHRNVERSLANMAYVKRLLAVQWRRKIDADAAARRRTDSADRERFAQLRGEALDHLRQAGAIYTDMRQHHGAGTVQVNSGLLHLDGGDLELAAAEAEAAYELGHEKNDHILMARARILQCMIENARVEEQVERASPHTALEYAREAIDLGGQTENSRLLARAHLWHGFTLAGDFFKNPEAARGCLDSATALVRPDGNDPLWADLQVLKGKLQGGGAVDTRLRAWSQGEVGNKSLQQLSEEFAEFVIPRVWEQEDRKVARVARRLKVSPKKVRRILARVVKNGQP